MTHSRRKFQRNTSVDIRLQTKGRCGSRQDYTIVLLFYCIRQIRPKVVEEFACFLNILLICLSPIESSTWPNFCAELQRSCPVQSPTPAHNKNQRLQSYSKICRCPSTERFRLFTGFSRDGSKSAVRSFQPLHQKLLGFCISEVALCVRGCLPCL